MISDESDEVSLVFEELHKRQTIVDMIKAYKSTWKGFKLINLMIFVIVLFF